MPFEALAIDLDGTLLVGDEVPPANVQALRDARDAGLKIIIATARWSHFALRLANEIGIGGPVIACSGAQVYDPDSGEDVFDRRLPEDFVAALYQICNAERCIATVTVGDHVKIKMDGRPDQAFLTDEMCWVDGLAYDASDLPRVAAIQGSGCSARIRAELNDAYADRVSILDSIGPTGKIILTITARNATKGAALQAACTHMALDPTNVVAFGDAENDVDMFRLAGASVAMGQADEATKSAASFVSKPNFEAGVAYAIRRLLDRGAL
jgi:Cof subfamily protein (haloacid dehalogenase superfamily)